MRKNISLLLLLLFLFGAAVPAAAAQNQSLVVDRADLLTSREEALLEEKARSVSIACSVDVVILTVDSMNGSYASDYAENFYESNNYGVDGVLFLLAMSEREWYIATCGSAIYDLTDYRIDLLGEKAVPYLSAGDYYGGFDVYLDALPTYLGVADNPVSSDGFVDHLYPPDYSSREESYYHEKEYGPNYLLSGLIGLAVAGIAVLTMRSAMNTKRPQRSAASYLKNSSYHLRVHQDVFLYSNISKVRRQENNNNRGGGGSSMHRSSGGRSFGGGGGKF